MARSCQGLIALPASLKRVISMSDTDSLRADVADALQTVGYGENHLKYDWRILDHTALANKQIASNPVTLDLAAFHDDRRHDWQTSAVMCDLKAENEVGDAELGHQRVRALFESTA